MTDRRRLAEGVANFPAVRDCVLAQARHAIDAAIDFVQIRERDLDAADLASLVEAAVALARGSRTTVLVNDRVDIAIACGAGGVHLREDSVPPRSVRAVAPDGFVIGRSVHDVNEAVAVAASVDYLIAGTIWPTPSKRAVHPLLGLDGLARICASVRVPVLAIGGVQHRRVAEIARTGAAGAAGIGVFLSDPGENRIGCRAASLVAAAGAMRRAFDTRGSAS